MTNYEIAKKSIQSAMDELPGRASRRERFMYVLGILRSADPVLIDATIEDMYSRKRQKEDSEQKGLFDNESLSKEKSVDDH